MSMCAKSNKEKSIEIKQKKNRKIIQKILFFFKSKIKKITDISS